MSRESEHYQVRSCQGSLDIIRSDLVKGIWTLSGQILSKVLTLSGQTEQILVLGKDSIAFTPNRFKWTEDIILGDPSFKEGLV